MTSHPIKSVIVDNVAVSKPDTRDFVEGDLPLRLANNQALRDVDLSTSWLVFIGGVSFTRDTSDATASDDDSWIIRDGGGNVWKKTPQLSSFDVYGNTAARSTYNAEAAGFTFFSLDEYGFYAKLSATSGDWSSLVPFRGPRGGDVYDLGFWDNGKPTSGEVLLKFVFTRAVDFAAGLASSRCRAIVAATGTAVYSLQKNGVEFGTATFAASGTTATFASASGASFAAGDVLTIVAPNPQDATLSGVHGTLAGTRN